MKALLINIIVLFGIVVLYYSGLLSLFASKYALLCSLLLVAVVLLIGLKVLGNPFERGKKND